MTLNREALRQAAHKLEDTLLAMRETRASTLGYRAGLVIRDEDGNLSSVMRLGLLEALELGVRAYMEAGGCIPLPPLPAVGSTDPHAGTPHTMYCRAEHTDPHGHTYVCTAPAGHWPSSPHIAGGLTGRVENAWW